MAAFLLVSLSRPAKKRTQVFAPVQPYGLERRISASRLQHLPQRLLKLEPLARQLLAGLEAWGEADPPTEKMTANKTSPADAKRFLRPLMARTKKKRRAILGPRSKSEGKIMTRPTTLVSD